MPCPCGTVATSDAVESTIFTVLWLAACEAGRRLHGSGRLRGSGAAVVSPGPPPPLTHEACASTSVRHTGTPPPPPKTQTAGGDTTHKSAGVRGPHNPPTPPPHPWQNERMKGAGAHTTMPRYNINAQPIG